MDRIKAFFMAVGSFFCFCGKKINNLVADISTALREGGTDSALSSKRIAAVTLIVVGIKLLFVGAGSFVQIMDKGWQSIFIFIPSALCFSFATIYFFINGQIDIADAAAKAKDIVSAAKGTV
jgi:uncharacterized membrane protein